MRIQVWKSPIVLLLVLLCLVVVIGDWLRQQSSQSAADRLYMDYLERLARVLDEPLPDIRLPESPKLPPRRERLLPAREIKIDLLDFWSLLGCDLQALVAERNTSLGRMMNWSQRWRYDVEFIQQAQQCVDRRQSDPDATTLLETLQLVIKQKRVDLPRVQWNSLWASAEMEALLAMDQLPIAPDELPAVEEVELALARIQGLLVADVEGYDSTALEAALQQLSLQPIAGRLLISAQRSAVWLQKSSQLIEQRLGKRPICFDRRPNERARILRNILVNRYVANIQPYLADLNRARQKLVPGLAAMAKFQPVPPSEKMTQYLKMTWLPHQPQSIWREFDQAVMHHASVWTQLLEDCGLQPGRVSE